MSKVAVRALGFDINKAEVLKILKDHNKSGRGLMEFKDCAKISYFFRLVTDCQISLSRPLAP